MKQRAGIACSFKEPVAIVFLRQQVLFFSNEAFILNGNTDSQKTDILCSGNPRAA